MRTIIGRTFALLLSTLSIAVGLPALAAERGPASAQGGRKPASRSPEARPPSPSPAAFEILRFDSETGAFDAELPPEEVADLWRRWKASRRMNRVLNPDTAHGAECGTHRYLHARWLLRTPLLKGYSLFLVRPGGRPCDHDQTCQAAKGDQRVCAHTQHVLDYPVIVGPRGSPYRDYPLDREFFNALIAAESMRVGSAEQAGHVAALCLFLTTTGRHGAVSITEVEARPETKGGFTVCVSLTRGDEVLRQTVHVAPDGTVAEAPPRG